MTVGTEQRLFSWTVCTVSVSAVCASLTSVWQLLVGVSNLGARYCTVGPYSTRRPGVNEVESTHFSSLNSRISGTKRISWWLNNDICYVVCMRVNSLYCRTLLYDWVAVLYQYQKETFWHNQKSISVMVQMAFCVCSSLPGLSTISLFFSPSPPLPDCISLSLAPFSSLFLFLSLSIVPSFIHIPQCPFLSSPVSLGFSPLWSFSCVIRCYAK